MQARSHWVVLVTALLTPSAGSGQEKGFQPERRVREPTRLDWEFAVGKDTRLPGSYSSRRQRYQLFVPPKYAATRSWPLVLFLSPGDDPLGWRSWRGPCETEGWLFAAPYGTGNNCPPAQRVRAALDVLDDVRLHYRIDPERTYLAGLGGGCELACQLAFALPELVGGVVCIGGDVPLPRLVHLRHRLRDRLSVALVCPKGGPARPLQEQYLATLLPDLDVRCRLWLTADAAHGLPGRDVVEEVQRWLDDDLKRRRADAADAGLGVEDTPTRRMLARRALARARTGLRDPEGLYRWAALLEWIVARCGIAGDAEASAELLRQVREDPVRGPILLRESEAEALAWLAARGRALEKLGDLDAARRAWEGVARLADAAEQKQAQRQARRLAGLLAKAPFLGLTFAGATTTVKDVVAGGPAAGAGLRAGDAIDHIDKVKVATLTQLREQVKGLRPGDEVRIGLWRGGKPLTLTVRVGALPPD